MNTCHDPIQRARVRSRRDQLKVLAWVLALATMLTLIKILVGSCC